MSSLDLEPFSKVRRDTPLGRPEPKFDPGKSLRRDDAPSIMNSSLLVVADGRIYRVQTPTQTLALPPQHVSLAVQTSPTSTQELDATGDGAADGPCVGKIEGKEEGGLDGIKDGTHEGALDGTTEGVSEGVSDGTEVGNDVSTIDGESEGSTDATVVGADDGLGLGTLD